MSPIPNINDIARAAKVSRATVSRVINNSPDVSARTRSRVLKVIEEFNYIPNSAARTLVRRKTDIIGVLINNVSDIFWSRIIRGIEATISNSRFSAIYSNNRYSTDYLVPRIKFKENLMLMTEGRVDGIIVASTRQLEDEDIEFLTSRKVPFVVIQSTLQDSRVNYVNIDNFKGAYMATQYLIDLGHRNLLHVTGPLESGIAQQRLEGFKKALEDNGIKFSKRSFLTGNFRYNEGHLRMKQILSWDVLPEAVLFGNDLMAFGAIQAAREANVKIPEDISVMGFDGLIGEFEFDGLMPQLTTMHQPMNRLGEYAARILLDQIDGLNSGVQQMVFDVELVEKGSCTRKV